MQGLLAETSTKWAAALVLALIAGYLDGYGLLRLGVFASFMSGNTTTIGVRTGQGNLHAALPPAVAIAFFFTGSLSGSLLMQWRLHYPHRLIFGLIASMLAIVGLERHVTLNVLFEIATVSMATGMINPVLPRVGRESVSLTFVTGTLKRVADHLASAVVGKSPQDSRGPLDSHLRRAAVDASLWSGFLGGATIAGLVVSRADTWALLPPGAILICLAASDRFDHAGGRNELCGSSD
jgi:uncharacterized membrane protein YoaK (UPF0700 family)